MTATGIFNPNTVLKDYVRGLGLNETSKTDRHIMLEAIRAALGAEKFSEWYDQVYKLRSAGNHTEYEQAIKQMFETVSPNQTPTNGITGMEYIR